MALTLFQKLKLAFRGWSRRSEENAARKRQEFVSREGSWGKPVPSPAPAQEPKPSPSKKLTADIEGLQVAFLDDSGHFVHYLDTESGEVLDVPIGQESSYETSRTRYRRVPRRSVGSEAADREAFVATLDEGSDRARLSAVVADAQQFRAQLATNRLIEKRWYSFKNDRANEAVTEWLEGESSP